MGKLAIARPITITMFTLFYFLLGIAAYFVIPRDLFPKISTPSLRVITEYNGASSSDIEEQITKKLEERLAGVKGVTRMSSYSGEERSEIILEFDFATNLDFASIEVREKLDQIEGELPGEAEKTIIERWDPSAQAVIVANITSGYSHLNLRQHLDKTVKVQLERIPGVASVKIEGGETYQVRLKIAGEKLQQYHLSLGDVEAAVTRENINLRGGRLVDSHTEILVRTVGKMVSLKELEDLVVARKPDNIYLKDLLAKRPDMDDELLSVEPETTDTISRLKVPGDSLPQNSVQILIYKKPASDTVKICQQARDILADYRESQKNAIPDLKVTITLDQAAYIVQSLDNIKSSAIYGIILAVVILLVFLRNIESTMIIALSMPISVIAAFSLFYCINMGLNLFSLAGITLAVGMVVDNAIVVIESVFSNRETLRKLDRAILFSLTEVGPPIVSSTLTTLAVFIPLLFVKGFIGQIFYDLSCTIVFSLSFSLVVAFTVIPMLLYQIGSISFGPLTAVNRFLDRYILSLLGWAGRAFLHAYSHTMSWILQRWTRRLLLISATAAIFVVSLIIIPQGELLPAITGTEMMVKVICPMELNLKEKDAIAREVENILIRHDEIAQFATTVSAKEIHFLLSLKEYAPDLASALRQEIGRIPDVRNASINTVSPLHTLFSRSGADITVQVLGPDLEQLENLCTRVEEEFQENKLVSPHLTDIENSMSEKKLEMTIHVDKERVADRQATTASIAHNVATAIAGAKVCDIVLPEWGRIAVHLSLALRDEEDFLHDLPVKGVQNTFPLKEVARVAEVRGPVSIFREERQRAGLVAANIRSESEVALETLSELLSNPQKTGVLDNIALPPGYRISLVGRSEAMEKSFASLIFALIAAVVLVYMVMAAQFESLLHPFAIMFSLPLAGIGAFFSLRLCGLNLSTPAFIGFILLAGIVVNNAIILIDYINILRTRGYDRNEAILTAGKARMRPIFMTTLTTVLGMLPMALAIGAGASLYQPLAVVVIGGLSMATLLTLIFIPTIYCFFDDIKEFSDFVLLRLSLLFGRR